MISIAVSSGESQRAFALIALCFIEETASVTLNQAIRQSTHVKLPRRIKTVLAQGVNLYVLSELFFMIVILEYLMTDGMSRYLGITSTLCSGIAAIIASIVELKLESLPRIQKV